MFTSSRPGGRVRACSVTPFTEVVEVALDATGVGRHAVCEFWGASHLDSVEHAERALRAAAEAGGVSLIDVFVHQFSPHGVSGVAVIAESHLAIHTWPEFRFAAADVFSCGAVLQPQLAAEYLAE